MSHGYPGELARFAHARWQELESTHGRGAHTPRDGTLPSLEALERLLSVAYQASLLCEEERAVTFRLFVGEPEHLPADAGPPEGLHRLTFVSPRVYDENEIRRLSPAAKYHRALIGVRQRTSDGFEIWGVIQSGPRWLQSARGGRALPSPVPSDAIVVRAQGPGHLAVSVGDFTLAELRGGRLAGGTAMNVFDAHWLRARFPSLRTDLLEEHLRTTSGHAARVPLDPELTGAVSQQMVKRLIATMQETHHGGTILFVPRDRTEELLAHRSVSLKYEFEDGPARWRYRTLMLAVMRELAIAGSQMDPLPESVGWSLYQGSTRPVIAALDEAILEMSQLLAGLSDVDGAVLLNEAFEIVGFGGEIGGSLPEITAVRRALDTEATAHEMVAVDRVGTRHRSAYRLCAHEPAALAIIVSQDGGVQFAAWHDGAVTYWQHRQGG